MSALDSELDRLLESIREAQLLRTLKPIDSAQGPRIEFGRRSYLNFSSNDYLGLANEPTVKESAIRAIEKWGAGSGASRLICGSLQIHHELEEELAHFKQTEAALSFSSGYAAAVGTICALMGKDDVIVLDKLVHASIVDAARLSGAKLRIFRHNDCADLEKILKQESRIQPERGLQSAASSKHPVGLKTTAPARKLVITESVFSMDGDTAPLKKIVQLKEKYGAWLMLDEAHGTGVLGPNRRGLAEVVDVSQDIEIQMGTLGKAFGSAGGYICGTRKLIGYLINKARSFIFSTAPVPAAAGAALAGVRLVASNVGKAKCKKLWQNISELSAQLQIATPKSAILPVIIGDESTALKVADKLMQNGVYIPAIRYPTVPKSKARLRITVTAAHSSDDLDAAANALSEALAYQGH